MDINFFPAENAPNPKQISSPFPRGTKGKQPTGKCFWLHNSQIQMICKSTIISLPQGMLNYHGFSSQAVLALGLLAFLLKIYRWIRAILSSIAAKKPLPDIPQDVIIEILSRLPVKTLCRFRCVSRSWHNLISDPGFIRLHLDFNRNNNKDKVFIVSTKEHCSPSSYSDQGNAEPLKETSVLHSADDGTVVLLLRKCVQTFKISGSCDGLLLLIDKPGAPSSKNSILILFNPSIRECKKLPEWPYSNEFEDQDEYSISGFGYNSRTNDYEVVRIGYDISDTKYGDCVASLYSMKTNSWRRIKATPPCRRDPSFEDSVGILSNGVLHWLLKYRTAFKNFLMVASYTLADEKFSHVPLPSSVDGKRYCQLGVLRGCLGIIVHEYEHFNVWVMREYGIEDSWIKLTVEFPNVSLTVTLMRFSRNDELLLRIDDINLVLIKPEMKRTRGVKTCGVQHIRDAAGFCESLVSPHHLQNEAKH